VNSRWGRHLQDAVLSTRPPQDRRLPGQVGRLEAVYSVPARLGSLASAARRWDTGLKRPAGSGTGRWGAG